MNKHNQTQSHRYREKTGGCQREKGGGVEKQVREIKRYKLSVTKQMSHGYEMYSVGNIVNNYVISLVTNGKQAYHDDHFQLYRNIKLLCYIQGTNIGLQVNYTSKTNKQTNS